MTSEVGSGQVAIFPTFKGFRRAMQVEVDGSTSDASSRFTTGFARAGASAGRGFGSALSNGASPGLRAAQADIAKAAAAVSTARLREQDAAGRVRVAEASLASARSKFATDSVQVVRAEERLATTERSLQSQQESLAASSRQLTAARLSVAGASDTAARSGLRLNNIFGTLPSILKVSGNESGQRFLTGFTDVLGGVVGANILTGVGFAVGRSINNVIVGGIRTGLRSVNLASDLNETTSAIGQVFGPASAGILAFSKTADKALGQTRQEVLLGAQSFGVFGKAAGLEGPKLVGFSTSLVQMAGDLASFYNTTPSDAITAITAGLRGESEPLRQYGVLLDDATLRQKALELGIVSTTKHALTPQQRVLAAQAVIMQQTGIAQGDFARTSSGLANQQRILQASLADVQTQLGTYLLPSFGQLVGYADSTLLPRLGTVIDRVGPKLALALQAAKPGVRKLLDDLGPMADKFAVLAEKDLPGMVKGLDDVANGLGGAAQAWGGFQDFLSPGGAGDISGSITKRLKISTDALHGFFTDFAQSQQPDLKRFMDFGKSTGSDWTSMLAAGIADGGKDKFYTAFQNGPKAGADQALKDFNFNTFSTGSAFGQGLADGMRAKGGEVAKAGAELGKSAIQGARGALRVASPSKEAQEIGQRFGDGLGLGMRARLREVTSASRALAGAAIGGVGSPPSAAVAGGGGRGSSSVDRPIYADGSLFGWIRELANGEARLVVADAASSRKTKLSTGQQKAAF